MRRIAALLLLVMADQAAIAAAPVWNSHPRLACKTEYVRACELTAKQKCLKKESTASFVFDFRSSVMQNNANGRRYRILSQVYKNVTDPSGDVNTVFISTGSMVSFLPMDPRQPRAVKAVSYSPNAQVAGYGSLICRPA